MANNATPSHHADQRVKWNAGADGTIASIPSEQELRSLRTTAIEEQLAEALRIIEANSTAKIIIEGHADSTGNDQINLPLSELRASQVLDYLIQAGVSPDRLSIVGYGSSQPLGDNNTADGRAQNRRVDFAVE